MFIEYVFQNVKMTGHRIKYISLVVFLLFLPDAGYAGDEKSYLYLGGGWAYSGLRDEGLSPLYYTGNHLYVSSGFQKRSDRSMNFLDISFLHGIISPAINPELTVSEMRNTHAEITFSHLRLAGSFLNENIKLFLGGSATASLAYHKHNLFVNSSLTSYSINTINLNSRLSYFFVNCKRPYLLEFQVYLPVAAFVIRPAHAYIKPKGFLDHSTGAIQSAINSIEIVTVDRYFGLNSQVAFEYPFRNNNALRFIYEWEFSEHQDRNQLQSAMHGIFLQTMFNF
jgi:hypothetical protein